MSELVGKAIKIVCADEYQQIGTVQLNRIR